MDEQRMRNLVRALRDAARDELKSELFTMQFIALPDDFDLAQDVVAQFADDDTTFSRKMEALVKLQEREPGCGTPCCAFGHYAARRDLQEDYYLDANGHFWTVFPQSMNLYAHFGISPNEELELFDANGCGGAKTLDEAADYIERFIERKLRENE